MSSGGGLRDAVKDFCKPSTPSGHVCLLWVLGSLSLARARARSLSVNLMRIPAISSTYIHTDIHTCIHTDICIYMMRIPARFYCCIRAAATAVVVSYIYVTTCVTHIYVTYTYILVFTLCVRGHSLKKYIYLSICLSIYLSIYLSFFLSIYPSIYLSIWPYAEIGNAFIYRFILLKYMCVNLSCWIRIVAKKMCISVKFEILKRGVCIYI